MVTSGKNLSIISGLPLLKTNDHINKVSKHTDYLTYPEAEQQVSVNYCLSCAGISLNPAIFCSKHPSSQNCRRKE
jgi:hypothetical protein